MFAKLLGHIIMFMKYHFVVRFTIGYVYDKVKDKQIVLNYLNYTSLGSLFHLKKAAFDRHCITICQNVLVLIKRLCVYMVVYF